MGLTSASSLQETLRAGADGRPQHDLAARLATATCTRLAGTDGSVTPLAVGARHKGVLGCRQGALNRRQGWWPAAMGALTAGAGGAGRAHWGAEGRLGCCGLPSRSGGDIHLGYRGKHVGLLPKLHPRSCRG